MLNYVANFKKIGDSTALMIGIKNAIKRAIASVVYVLFSDKSMSEVSSKYLCTKRNSTMIRDNNLFCLSFQKIQKIVSYIEF